MTEKLLTRTWPTRDHNAIHTTSQANLKNSDVGFPIINNDFGSDPRSLLVIHMCMYMLNNQNKNILSLKRVPKIVSMKFRKLCFLFVNLYALRKAKQNSECNRVN